MLRGRRFYLDADLDGTGGGPGNICVLIKGGVLELRGFSIRNADRGVFCGKRCTIIGPGTIGDNRIGVEGYSARIIDVTLSAMQQEAVKMHRRLTVEGSQITNNGAGIRAAGVRTKLLSSQITGNRMDGIRTFGVLDGECVDRPIALIDSTISGNNTGPYDGTQCEFGATTACADIRTCDDAPILDATSSCGSSFSVASGSPWGVRTLD